MKNLILKTLAGCGLLCLVLAAGCEKQNEIVNINTAAEHANSLQPAVTSPVEQPYNRDSWRSVISRECMSFFDGCNNCRRIIDSNEAACTKKFCSEYTKPVCHDTASTPEPAPQGFTAKEDPNNQVHEYHCNEGTFRVYFGEYVQDDQRMKLKDGQVMFADAQTRTVSLLSRDTSASGSKYSNEFIVFWNNGSDAMVSVNNERTYNNCKQVIFN